MKIWFYLKTRFKSVEGHCLPRTFACIFSQFFWSSSISLHFSFFIKLINKTSLTRSINVVPPRTDRERRHELGIEAQRPCHQSYRVGGHLQLDGVLLAFHLLQCVQQQLRRHIVEDSVRGHQNHVAIPHGELERVRRLGTVTQHVLAVARWRHRQLERCVEVVLLLFAAVHNLSVANHNEAAVADVGCVQGSVLPVQDQHTGRAAA